jgi:hypothetical protein
MGQTLYNGAWVPTPGDPYAPTDDLKKLALSLNLPIPVMNQGQRDALFGLVGGSLPTGTIVIRRDQSMRLEIWNGTAWADGAPHTEWYSNDKIIPNATVFGVGALTQDAAKTTDTAFITHPTADAIKYRDAGTYSITFAGLAEATMNGRSFLEIQAANGVVFRSIVTGEDRGFVAIPNYRAAANEVMVFDAYHNSGATRQLDFRVAVTRVG